MQPFAPEMYPALQTHIRPPGLSTHSSDDSQRLSPEQAEYNKRGPIVCRKNNQSRFIYLPTVTILLVLA